jgi:hypothetical protein
MEQDLGPRRTLTPESYRQDFPPVSPNYYRQNAEWIAGVLAVVLLVGIGLWVRDAMRPEADDADASSFAYRAGYRNVWSAGTPPEDNVYTQLPRSEWEATADERIADGVEELVRDCDGDASFYLDYLAGKHLALQDKAMGKPARVFPAGAPGLGSGFDCD